MRGRQTSDVATLAKLIAALAPYDGSVDLRGAGVHAIRLSHSNDEPVHYVQPSSLCIVAQGAKVVMIGEELATLVNMSVTSFHRQFRAVTGMSPLQYQKTLRLQEARRLMLATSIDAGAAGRRVGYVSASQFSREYSRFFGSAPAQDIHRLRSQAPGAADVPR